MLCISVTSGGFLATIALTRQHADVCLATSAIGAFAAASATLTKGMKELTLSGSTTCNIYLGAMLVIVVLSQALLSAYGQPGMNWIFNPITVFAAS